MVSATTKLILETIYQIDYPFQQSKVDCFYVSQSFFNHLLMQGTWCVQLSFLQTSKFFFHSLHACVGVSLENHEASDVDLRWRLSLVMDDSRFESRFLVPLDEREPDFFEKVLKMKNISLVYEIQLNPDSTYSAIAFYDKLEFPSGRHKPMKNAKKETQINCLLKYYEGHREALQIIKFCSDGMEWQFHYLSHYQI